MTWDTYGRSDRAIVYWWRSNEDYRFWRVWLSLDYFPSTVHSTPMKAVMDDFGDLRVVQA